MLLLWKFWHSIFTCLDYHSLYQNNYDPLPKFNKSSNFDIKHADNFSTYVKKKMISKRTQQVRVLKISN